MPVIAVECSAAFAWMGNCWICCCESIGNLHSTRGYLRKEVPQERKQRTERRNEIVATDIRISLNGYRAYEPLASNICSCNTSFSLAKFLQPAEIIGSISIVPDAQCVRLYWPVVNKCLQLRRPACLNPPCRLASDGPSGPAEWSCAPELPL